MIQLKLTTMSMMEDECQYLCFRLSMQTEDDLKMDERRMRKIEASSYNVVTILTNVTITKN